MKWNTLNTKTQGAAGVGAAIGYFSLKGYTVSVPLLDNQEYDLIVENLQKELLRVQVKTTRYKRIDNFIVELRTKGGNKTGSGKTKKIDLNMIDLLFVLTESKEMYLIPSEKIETETVITLGSKYSEYRI